MLDRLVFASLLLALAIASGCATAEVADARIGSGEREGFAVVTAAGAGPLGGGPSPDLFLEIAGSKPGGLAFVQNTPDTWGPFDVQVHTGFFDPAQKASPNGVRVCLEIDNVGFSVYYDVCAQYNQGAGLWQVFAFTHAGALAGSVNLPDDEIELRVEQVSDDVNFYTRAFGSGSWQPVSTTSFPAQTAPLKAAFGATGLSKGTAVGFDDAVYVSGPPLVAPSAAAAVAADVNAALLAGYTAFQEIEDGNLGSAETDLGDAADALDDAQLGVAALPPSKAVSSAAKQIGKADKTLAKAQDQVAVGDGDKALKTLQKLARPLIEAALLLNPQPLPGP
jgi:hypothetical protein